MTADQILSIALAIIGTLLCGIGSWIASILNRLTESVEKLNVNMASVVEKVNTHEKRIERLESRRK